MKDKFEAEDLIKQAIDRYEDNIAVACSFGKDSMVVLHMALKYKPNIKVLFHNTGVEFPETIAFKNRIKTEWNLNLIETKPYKDMTFWKCIDKYGLPQFRSGKSKYHSPKCCYYLKEKPAMNIIKQYGIQLRRCFPELKFLGYKPFNKNWKGYDALWAVGYYCGSAGHVSAEAVARYIAEQNGKEVFDYDIYGTPEHLKGQCKIGDFS
jgi:REP element-mobilizing transposase RayT